jgi:hypothetical protein
MDRLGSSVTSFDRENQENATVSILWFLRQSWDRPEYAGGRYPEAIKQKLDELIDLVMNGSEETKR